MNSEFSGNGALAFPDLPESNVTCFDYPASQEACDFPLVAGGAVSTASIMIEDSEFMKKSQTVTGRGKVVYLLLACHLRWALKDSLNRQLFWQFAFDKLCPIAGPSC